MKTILQVHIFVRLFASFCIIYGLYRLILAWPQLSKLNDLVQKQKENALLSGREFDLSAFIPAYAELLLAPILVFHTGVFAFLGTRQVVRWIIGRKQIEALLDMDGKDAQSR